MNSLYLRGDDIEDVPRDNQAQYLNYLEDLVSNHPSLRPAVDSMIVGWDVESVNSSLAIESYTEAIVSFCEISGEIKDNAVVDIINQYINELTEKIENLNSPIYNGEAPPTYEQAVGSPIPDFEPPEYPNKEENLSTSKFIPAILQKSTSWRLKTNNVEDFDETCYMIGLGVKNGVEKFLHCKTIQDAQINLESSILHPHVYRYSEGNAAFNSAHGVIYKADFPFIFTDYAPLQFRKIRNSYGITCEDYIHAICGTSEDDDDNEDEDNTVSHSLTSMLAEGKSSASFLITTNRKIIVKSMKPQEFEFFRTLLPDYCEYLSKQPNTLLSRFYGLFQIQKDLNPPRYYIVMGNIIPDIPDILRYDLKGSTSGRMASEEQKKNGGVLKDLDFSSFVLGDTSRNIFWKQLESDTTFLEKHDIMDYSLLVGEKYLKKNETTPITIPEGFLNGDLTLSYFNYPNGAFQASYEDGTRYPIDYYIGIIDILQTYNIRKKVENALKRISESQGNISCVDPATYSSRFLGFIKTKTSSIIKPKEPTKLDFSSNNPFDFLPPIV